VQDLITSPAHLGELFAPNGLLRRPAFYFTLLGAGAALGGAFALDRTMRSSTRHMGLGLADGFETGGNFFSYSFTGFFYLWGLQSDNERLRQDQITGFASAGISSLITLGLKDAFGRLRPRQNHGPWAFFDNGDSFVSGAATPVFALAAATSESFDNAWYVAIPAYAGAASVGLGRMGKDAHWFSDIVGSALVGIGTTELLLFLHRRNESNRSRYWIFPVTPQGGGAGVKISLNW
jgi:membrane-associated phospholipid phosphatase